VERDRNTFFAVVEKNQLTTGNYFSLELKAAMQLLSMCFQSREMRLSVPMALKGWCDKPKVDNNRLFVNVIRPGHDSRHFAILVDAERWTDGGNFTQEDFVLSPRQQLCPLTENIPQSFKRRSPRYAISGSSR
jgi:hypothetical protein